MKSSIKWLILSIGALFLTSCASGPKFTEVQSSIPQLNPEHGRIFIYRTAVVGFAIQPNVLLNGKRVGKAVPMGYFYVDRPPGSYEVLTSTEVDRTLSLTLEKGQTRYVRLDISMGFFTGHIYPTLVDNEVGQKEIVQCSNTKGESG